MLSYILFLSTEDGGEETLNLTILVVLQIRLICAKKVSVLCDMLAAETERSKKLGKSVVSAVQLAALILLRLSLCEYLYPLHVVLKQPFTHFSIV